MKKSFVFGLLVVSTFGVAHAKNCSFVADKIPISFDAFTGEGYANQAYCKIVGTYVDAGVAGIAPHMHGDVRCDFAQLGNAAPGAVYLTFAISSDVPTPEGKSPTAFDGKYYVNGKLNDESDYVYKQAFKDFDRHTFVYVQEHATLDDALSLFVTYQPENKDYKDQVVVNNQTLALTCK